ncbi:GGDEF domain-containing protein [Lysobacter humi (ex Lee et al. 2017)]
MITSRSIAETPAPGRPRGPGGRERVLALVAGRDPRRRIRLLQWVTAGGVYAAAAALMVWGIDHGWMRAAHLVPWAAFVASGIVTAYVALRSGWSERLRDPALTEWQIAMAIVAVCWGYLICGPIRTVTLFPLLLIFAFGAFALPRRRIVGLALFASLSLVAVTGAHILGLAPSGDEPPAASLPLDVINLVMSVVLLSAFAVVAARLSALRSSLRDKGERLRQALAEVQRLATTDELTGLPNRRSMMQRLEGLRGSAGACGTGFCVAVIDIDHFKQINDSLGHAQGDAVLWTFADHARMHLRDTDLMGRWGGEEFLIVMLGLTLPQAVTRVESLLQATRGIDAASRPLTFSAGVAALQPDDDVSSLVLRADQAMYAAKQHGRNRVHAAARTVH